VFYLPKKIKIESLKNELIADLKKSEADLRKSKANLKKSEAELKIAIVDLESTNIYAPIDGVIANRIAEPGIYVEDGWPLMAIVPIQDIWIIANYKETQVEDIKVGQKVRLYFDAFKNTPIMGKVHSISPASSASFSLLPPQNASGNFVKVVQRVPVKITFETPKNMLGRIVPGLSVYVSIEIKP
jgi:membrane fusion protein (multidrug efflux system)